MRMRIIKKRDENKINKNMRMRIVKKLDENKISKKGE